MPGNRCRVNDFSKSTQRTSERWRLCFIFALVFALLFALLFDASPLILSIKASGFPFSHAPTFPLHSCTQSFKAAGRWVSPSHRMWETNAGDSSKSLNPVLVIRFPSTRAPLTSNSWDIYASGKRGDCLLSKVTVVYLLMMTPTLTKTATVTPFLDTSGPKRKNKTNDSTKGSFWAYGAFLAQKRAHSEASRHYAT